MKQFLLLVCMLVTVPSYAQFMLNFEFQNMTPHIGHTGHIRVIDVSSMKEVARVRETIPSAGYSVQLLCLQVGRSYNVDFYADFNMNGVYDEPPADHTWRRVIDVVTADVNLLFVHNTQFTNINYPNEPPVTTDIITSDWSGRWHNNTFNTDSTAAAQLTLNGTTNRMSGSITMNGAFGSPVPVTITGSGPYDQVTDSAEMIVEAPLSGTIYFVRGRVTGEVTYTAFGVTMNLTGNYGDDQMMLYYVMSGQFTANGWMVLEKTNTTDVNEPPTSNLTSSLTSHTSNLTTLNLNWDATLGEAQSITICDLTGAAYKIEMPTYSERGVATLNISAIPTGVYVVKVQCESNTLTALVLLTN